METCGARTSHASHKPALRWDVDQVYGAGPHHCNPQRCVAFRHSRPWDRAGPVHDQHDCVPVHVVAHECSTQQQALRQPGAALPVSSQRQSPIHPSPVEPCTDPEHHLKLLGQTATPARGGISVMVEQAEPDACRQGCQDQDDLVRPRWALGIAALGAIDEH